MATVSTSRVNKCAIAAERLESCENGSQQEKNLVQNTFLRNMTLLSSRYSLQLLFPCYIRDDLRFLNLFRISLVFLPIAFTSLRRLSLILSPQIY